MLLLAIPIIVLGIILFALYAYFSWHRNYWIERGVPGPEKNLISGSFPKSLLQKVHNSEEINEIYKKYHNTTPYVGLFYGRQPRILILEPDYIRNMLVRDFKSFQDNEFGDMINKNSDALLSRNPFFLNGDEWKEKRAEITPAFTVSKLKAMFPVIDDVCIKMGAYLQTELSKSPNQSLCLDAKELTSKFTSDVVSSCIYGVDSKAFSDEKSEIRQMGSEIFANDTIVQMLYFAATTLFPFITKFYTMPFVTKKVESFFTRLMQDAIRLRKERNIERDDYLSYLLELKRKKNISDLDMAAHTITFFLDGFETSSMVIAHALYMLAKHPDTQELLRNEIVDAVRENGSITFENIHNLQYLDQVVNETLRMFSPVGTLSRKCTIPTELTDFKDKKLLIEKDIIAMIPVYSIHYDSKYYSNPHQFDPSRFNGGIKEYKDAGVFLPFGDGFRQCLGMRFGLTQTKAAIIAVIKDFNVSVNEKTSTEYVIDPKSFLMWPIGGIWINVEKI